MAMGDVLRPAHEVRQPFYLSKWRCVLRRSAVLYATRRSGFFGYALVALFLFLCPSRPASARLDHLHLLEAQIKLPPLGLADQVYMYGAWFLLLAGGFAGVLYWRRKYRRRRRELGTTRSSAINRSSGCPPSLQGVDLKLLWFMSDEKTEALPAQIERYIAAFQADLQLTHATVLSRDAPQIHRSAHRLVAHAAAINYEPLFHLANKLQAEASNLSSDQLDKLMQEFDLHFAKLKLKITLAAIQFSTERA